MSEDKKKNKIGNNKMVERTIYILKILKDYTDEETTLTQAGIKEKFEEKFKDSEMEFRTEDFGTEKTLSKTINNIVNAINDMRNKGENPKIRSGNNNSQREKNVRYI